MVLKLCHMSVWFIVKRKKGGNISALATVRLLPQRHGGGSKLVGRVYRFRNEASACIVYLDLKGL